MNVSPRSGPLRLNFCDDVAARKVRSLSQPTRVYPSWASQIVEVGYIRLRWERVGMRGYGLTIGCNPSPGSPRRCFASPQRSDLSRWERWSNPHTLILYSWTYRIMLIRV